MARVPMIGPDGTFLADDVQARLDERISEAASAGVRAETAVTTAQARADDAYALADAAATPAMVDQKVSTATTGLVTEAALTEAVGGLVTEGELAAALEGFTPPSGGGVESVSGTVTLDATGEPIREFFTTGQTIFTVNGQNLTYQAGTAIVWRRDVSGVWGYNTIDTWMSTTGEEAPEVPALAAPANLKAVPGDTSVTVTWEAVTGAQGYVVAVDGGPWSNVGNVLTWSGAGFTPGTVHSVKVAAYAVDGLYSPEATVSFQNTGMVQATATDLFEAPRGTLLTAHTAGGIVWKAPSNETGVTGQTAAITESIIEAVPGTHTGAKTAYTGDVRFAARFRFLGSGEIRLHHGGNAVNVTLGKNTHSAKVEVKNDKAPVTWLTKEGPDFGVIAVEMIGNAVKCYLNGTVVGEWTAGAVATKDLGFLVNKNAIIEAFKVEPVTTTSPAPSISTDSSVAVGSVLTSDGFTGTDGTAILGRESDIAHGGRVSMWRGSANAAVIKNGVLDRDTLTAYSEALVYTRVQDHSITATLTKIPTAGHVRLQVRRPAIGISEAYFMQITPTEVRPGLEGAAAGTAFGAPQIGDKYTVSAKGDQITFTAQRADRSPIGSGAQTLTSTTRSGALAGFHAPSASAGWAFDDVIVKAV